jgi:hypothetical protein
MWWHKKIGTKSNRIESHCMHVHSVNYKNKNTKKRNRNRNTVLTLLQVLLNIVDDNFHQNTIIDHNH